MTRQISRDPVLTIASYPSALFILFDSSGASNGPDPVSCRAVCLQRLAAGGPQGLAVLVPRAAILHAPPPPHSWFPDSGGLYTVTVALAAGPAGRGS